MVKMEHTALPVWPGQGKNSARQRMARVSIMLGELKEAPSESIPALFGTNWFEVGGSISCVVTCTYRGMSTPFKVEYKVVAFPKYSCLYVYQEGNLRNHSRYEWPSTYNTGRAIYSCARRTFENYIKQLNRGER